MTVSKAYQTVILLLLSCMISISISAQQDERVLFTVDGHPVTVGEFSYIYEKNNSDEANYSRTSVEEYFELYKKFKLKVAAAKDANMDEIPELQQELEGYRKQLANSYLVDRQVEENLIVEAYKRSQEDREIAHILIQRPKKRTETAEEETRQKALKIKELLDKGQSWEEVVRQHSQDKASNKSDGYLGWFSAMLPAGFYELENATYDTEVGDISDPVPSRLGYHVVKVLDKRPARGQVEVAHILIKKQDDMRPVKLLADSVYSRLQAGGSFDEMAKLVSGDKNSSGNGGRIGYVKINQYEKTFEDAVFGLESDGEFTPPVLSSAGYHIIKRLRARDIADYEKASRRFKAELATNPRRDIARSKMIADIKSTSGYKEHQANISTYKMALGPDFLTYAWKGPKLKDKKIITFSGGMKFTTEELTEYLRSNIRERIKYKDRKSAQEVFDLLFVKFADQCVVKYEEENLENKYPDFKNLMREYSEGILLFEITKEHVWDKASTDTAGLKRYFNQHREDYQWGPRARIKEVRLSGDSPKLAQKFYKQTQKKGLMASVEKYSDTEGLADVRTRIKTPEDLPDGLAMERGAMTELAEIEDGYMFTVVDMLLPKSLKSLSESRGFVIADYQSVLEDEWVKELAAKYTITRNEEVFDSIIQ